MTREELLLTQLAEECCEVGKLVSKSLRFGLDDAHSKRTTTNRERLMAEVVDVIAVAKCLVEEGTFEELFEEVSDEKIKLKINKVERYLGVSEHLGRLC